MRTVHAELIRSNSFTKFRHEYATIDENRSPFIFVNWAKPDG